MALVFDVDQFGLIQISPFRAFPLILPKEFLDRRRFAGLDCPCIATVRARENCKGGILGRERIGYGDEPDFPAASSSTAADTEELFRSTNYR